MDTKKPKPAPGGADKRAKRPLSPTSKAFLIAVAVLLVVSVGARALLGGGEPAEQGASAQMQGDGFLPGQGPGAGGEPAPAEEPGGIERALPYITEGSFFALLGFAIGYASRKFLKVAMIVIAVFFVGLQILSYTDVIAIDWSRAVELMDGLVLNLKENETFSEVLTDRLPSAGAFLAAWFVGFKSG